MKRPAFAFPDTQPLNEYAEHGMTLRDYFAAKAMQSFMEWALDQESFPGYGSAEACAAAYAKHSYAIADAMLAERAK
jgi:hypothetical protein